MTTKGGGKPSKDVKISDGFNRRKPTITKRDMARAKRIVVAQAKLNQMAGRVSVRSNYSPSIPVLNEEGWPASPEEREAHLIKIAEAEALIRQKAKEGEPTEDVEDEELTDEKSAQEMINDMRWVYKQLKGRSKLKALMTGDKEFMAMVKELMKVEASILTNKLRAKDGGNGRQGFFVVLKGLEKEKPIERLTEAMRDKKPINIKQVERAMDPSADPLDMEDFAQDQKEHPAEIIKTTERVETAETTETIEGW